MFYWIENFKKEYYFDVSKTEANCSTFLKAEI